MAFAKGESVEIAPKDLSDSPKGWLSAELKVLKLFKKGSLCFVDLKISLKLLIPSNFNLAEF